MNPRNSSEEIQFSLKRIKKLESSLRLVRFLYENEDIRFCSILALDSIKIILEATKVLKKSSKDFRAYLDIVLKDRVESLEKHQKDLHKSISSLGSKDISDKLLNLPEVIDEIEEFVFILSRQLKLIGDPKQGLMWLLRKYRKRGGLIFSGTLLLLGLIFLGHYRLEAKKGLFGEFYLDTQLKKIFKTHRTPSIDFAWGEGGPFNNFIVDLFSIRWTGFLKVEKKGNYKIMVDSDDGVRVWINDELIINNWNVHKLATDVADIELSIGYYPIKIEYFENFKDATIKLFWKHPSDRNRKIIPSKNLVPHIKFTNLEK